jgi:anti-anti-sigma factor
MRVPNEWVMLKAQFTHSGDARVTRPGAVIAPVGGVFETRHFDQCREGKMELGVSARAPRPRRESRIDAVRDGAQFGMQFDFNADTTSIGLTGELDALTVPAFSAALMAIADRKIAADHYVVTIDLSGLGFCSVGGLRAMAELAARLHAVDGRVEIIAPTILTHLLEMSDLLSLFVIRDLTGALQPLSRTA